MEDCSNESNSVNYTNGNGSNEFDHSNAINGK
jgi:hypothetical protein